MYARWRVTLIKKLSPLHQLTIIVMQLGLYADRTAVRLPKTYMAARNTGFGLLYQGPLIFDQHEDISPEFGSDISGMS